MIENLFRQNIKNLIPYTSARDSFKSGTLLDANENSFGSVIESELSLNRYPDPHQDKLRSRLSSYLDIPKTKLFFGVGSDEILDLLIRIFCEPGQHNALICDPTYGMYKVLCDINGVESISCPLNKSFQLDPGLIFSKVNERSRVLFLCSPNNPTANLLNPEDILALCQKLNIIVVVDEAYIEFSENNALISRLENHRNLILVRTFSKVWGLAAIRAGYCIADESIISILFRIKSPYNVNKMTEDLILKALDSRSRMIALRDKILQERNYLIYELQKFENILVYPSDANFILIKIPEAGFIYNELIKRNIIIRNRSNLTGLENCLRITVGTRDENNLLLRNLRELI